MPGVHISPFSGQWYPQRPAELTALLEEVFANSERRLGPWVLPRAAGFVVPHAGLMYSGTVAAAAYRHLREQPPARIVVLGFSHRMGHAGIAVPDIGSIETPLGEVPVDRGVVEKLCASPPFHLVAESRVCDHSVEIQLPLLQHAAANVPVTPLYVGHIDDAGRLDAARTLAELAAGGAVFLVSSDFTHYGPEFYYRPFPCDEFTPDRLRVLDSDAMENTGSLDAALFLEFLDETGATLCGRAPIALWLETVRLLAGEEIFQEALDYQTSGDILDDYRNSVSYAALGYFPAGAFELGAEDRDLLLASARNTLQRLCETSERQPVPPPRITPGLTRKAAVFVSLHQDGRLLGCVGTPGERLPLAQAVPEMTLAAALDDPRFPSVLGVEGEIRVEISVLSPMRKLRDASGFCVNRHGAYLRVGEHSSLLLPQVAAGRGWAAEQFLEALSRKAGLGPKAWQAPEARLSVFRAQVFA